MTIRPYEQALSFVRQLGTTATTDDTSTNSVSTTSGKSTIAGSGTSAGAGTDLLKQLAITGSGDVAGSSSSESSTDLVKLLGVNLLDIVLKDNKSINHATDSGTGSGGGMVWMDPKTVNFALYSSVSKDRRLDKVRLDILPYYHTASIHFLFTTFLKSNQPNK